MKKTKRLSIAIFLMVFAFNSNADHLRESLLITAKLDGGQEVPAVSTNAIGVAGLSINPGRDTICVNISFTGLSGPVTGIHIHDGVAGMNGGVLKNLTPMLSGNRLTTSLTGTDASPSFISKLLKGELYLNVHTNANPNGEIRGQLLLETDWSYSVMLKGTNEVPPVTTTAEGLGVFNLSKDLSQIKYYVIVNGLSGPITGIHLHNGAMGVNGGVAVNLSNDVNGNIISGTIMSPSQMLIDSLMAHRIYLNVHTSANAGGEIRGQLMSSSRYLYFDSWLDGDQQVPMLSTGAKGIASILLNTSMDTLWYTVLTDGLSGAITMAHFHNAAAGSNGGVEIDLNSGIMGMNLMGTITGASLSKTFVNKLLKGEIYLNLHTSMNPGGEIRGQVYRLAREGYSISLDGTQEVPMVSTTASGSGIVSVDRDQSNAHIMIVVNGLNPTAAHFHKAQKGNNGGVIFNLTPWLSNNGVFGYWKNTDPGPFGLNNSLQLRKDSVYVNFHTSGNPNGEIRGQVMRSVQCFSNTAGSKEIKMASNELIELFPNPVTENLNLRLTLNGVQESKFWITDALGKLMYEEVVVGSSETIDQTINIKEWPEGLYLVRIQTGVK
ncbi:MAG: CHRD domain-containing protein, partial [Flavobacteriales bacterium]|nr:CHRD domain-containing protein [Flavobacteriales bacterium]